MKKNDETQFARLLGAVMELYNASVTEDAATLWWNALQEFTLDQVRHALSDHVKDGKRGMFTPKPADLIARLQRNDGWLDSEVAWSVVARALNDERVTIFWTAPMQSAFGVALNLQRDMVSARMAFKEHYENELYEARARGDKPVWQASPGTDPAQRAAAIAEALRLGRIDEAYADKLMPRQPAALVDSLKPKPIK